MNQNLVLLLLIAFLIYCVCKLIPYAYKRISPLFSSKSPQFQNAELVRVLLSLEEEPLNDLLKLYKKEFGPNAAGYARQTYHKWKAGEVRPNRQTFNRLLVYLPKVMSFDLKCEVLRKLREEYCATGSYRLTVYTDDWKDSLTPLVTSIINRARTADLPKAIEEKLKWLSGNEMQVARAILAKSQVQESTNVVSALQQQISNVEALLVNTKGTRKVTHKLKLPYGTITLKIKKR